MEKFQELLKKMAGARRRAIVFLTLAGLFFVGGVVVGTISIQRPHGTPAGTGGVEFIVLFSATYIFFILGIAAIIRGTNLLGEIRELPFYRIGDNYYTFDGPIGGVLEQLDSSLVAARIAANERYKTIPLPD